MKRRILWLLLLTAVATAAKDKEEKQRAKIARVFVDYARWCRSSGYKSAARNALAEATAADPGGRELEKLAAEVEALDNDKEDDKPLELRRKKAHTDAAKLYGKLGKLDHDAEDAARFLGFLVKAAELDPSKARLGRLAGLVKRLGGNRKTTDQAGRLLVRLREINPGGKYSSLEAELARKDVLLIKGDHFMVGYLSLPGGWKKSGSYPVLVAVDGAGSGFIGRARNFAKTRGKRPYLVLTPCSLSNTNELTPKKYPFYTPEQLQEWSRDRIGFDSAGLDSLLEAIGERFGGNGRFGITGFSGGGNLCYAMTVHAPERVLFSAPACANFSGMGFQAAKRAPEGGGPPIRIFTGEKDPHREFTHGDKNSPGIDPQTDRAVAALEELGYSNLTRTMLKGVGHSPCAKQVWDVADEVAK